MQRGCALLTTTASLRTVSPDAPSAGALGHGASVPRAALWPKQPFPAQRTGCALESCQTGQPLLAMAIPHSAAESGLAKGTGWLGEELEREQWEGRGHARQVAVVSQDMRAALPLPLTLLCHGWCSVSFLGLLAEVELWLLLWLRIPPSGDPSPWRSLQSHISVTLLVAETALCFRLRCAQRKNTLGQAGEQKPPSAGAVRCRVTFFLP